MPQKIRRLDLTTSSTSDFPQLDGGHDTDNDDDEESDEDDGSDYVASMFNVVQLDGAGEEPIEIKAEDVKQEAAAVRGGWSTPAAAAGRPVVVDSCLSSCSSAAEESSRPSTAGSCSLSEPVLCSDCGNTYGGRRAYAAHLSSCARGGVDRSGVATPARGVKQEEDEEEEEEEDRKPNISVSSDGGSPRKDFSIHNLLLSSAQQQQHLQQHQQQHQQQQQQHQQQHLQQQQHQNQHQQQQQRQHHQQHQQQHQQQHLQQQQQQLQQHQQQQQQHQEQQQPDVKDIKEEEIVILSESINTVRRDSSVPVHFRQPGSSINSARRQQQQLLTVTPASTAMQYINAISAMTQSLPTMGPSSLYHGSGATVVQYGGAPAYQQYAPSLLPALVQPLGGYITLQPPPPPTI